MLIMKKLNAASLASEFQFFIFGAHVLSIRTKHRLGPALLQSQNPEDMQPKSCVFWHVKTGCLESVPTRTLTLTQMNPEPCSLSYVKVSSKCRFRGLSKLLNPCERQTSFLSRGCRCQVCDVSIVLRYLTSKD